ncbi:MAG: hypothetical protein RL684_1982 [Pseudomonadota bacterium]|jgi:hypothetical protein
MAKTLNVEEPGAAPAATESQAEPGAAQVDTGLDPTQAPEPPPVVQEVQPQIIDNTPPGLPHASEIDATKIRGNVLTQQGWVLPEAAQTHAAG